MADTLSVDLVIDDSAVDKTKAKLTSLPANVTPAAKQVGDVFTKSISAVEIKALDLRSNLQRLSDQAIGTSGVDGLGKAADIAGTRIDAVFKRLEQIKAESAKAANNTVLDKLQEDAQTLLAELDQIQARFDSVAAQGRLFAGVVPAGPADVPAGPADVPASSVGNVASVAGTGAAVAGTGVAVATAGAAAAGGTDLLGGVLGVAGDLGSAGVVPERYTRIINALKAGSGQITKAVTAAMETAGVTGGFLAAAGGLAVVGYKFITITQDIRIEAERRLKVEEMLAGVYAKQLAVIRDINAGYEKRQKFTTEDKNFSQFLQTGSLDDLQKRLADLTKLRSLGPTSERDKEGNVIQSEESKRLEQQTIDLQSKIFDKKLERDGSSAKAFNENNEAFKKSQADAAKFEKERLEKFNQSVKQGIDKANELKKTWESAFDSLNQRASESNPFAVFFAKADTEARKLTESLKGLPPELQKIARQMKAAADSKDLFSLSLDNRLSVAALRNDAENFRNPFDPKKEKKKEDDYVARFLQDNPNYLYLNQGKSPEDIRADILKRGEALFDSPQKRKIDILNEQYQKIYDRRQPNFDLATADKKFNSVTQGVDPLTLPDDLRNAAAASRERDATRQEQYQAEAQKIRRDQLDVQRKLVEQQKALIDIAQKRGLEGVQISVKNSSGADVAAKSATPDDVASQYDFPGFDVSGGTNR